MDKIEVTQWRKKPVVVEAMKYPGHTVTGVDTLLAFEDWIEPLAKATGRWPLTYRGQSLIIPTLEGDHEAKPGDYIIRGVSGEIYPCKPDIFAKTYESALATRTDATPVAWMYERENDAYSELGPHFVLTRFKWSTTSNVWTETPLFSHPPATDVAALVEAAKASAEGWANAVEFNLLPVQHWQTANDLQRQIRQALAPFTKGQNDDAVR